MLRLLSLSSSTPAARGKGGHGKYRLHKCPTLAYWTLPSSHASASGTVLSHVGRVDCIF